MSLYKKLDALAAQFGTCEHSLIPKSLLESGTLVCELCGWEKGEIEYPVLFGQLIAVAKAANSVADGYTQQDCHCAQCSLTLAIAALDAAMPDTEVRK